MGKGFTEVSGPGTAEPPARPTAAPRPTFPPPIAPPPGPPTVAAPARVPSPPPPRRDPDQLAWRYPPSGAADEPGRPLRGCPAIDAQGRVFACIQHRLLMFPIGTKTPQWEYPTGGPIPRSPAIGPDGNVRVHSCDGYLHVVDPGGGPVFEPVAVGEPLGWASPLVDQQNNTWVSRSEGGLIKVDPSGHPGDRPFFRTRRRFDCTGLIHDDVLYIGCEDHYVYAIPLGGQRGKNAWAGSPECGRTGCAINSALALTDGPQLLVGSQDDHLHAFGLDGRELWTTLMPGHMLGSPVADQDGTVFVPVSQNPRDRDARGMLVSVDRTSHQIRWQHQVDAPVESTPVIGDDGILYFGDNDGTIHAVDLQGKLVWKAEFEAPVRSAGTIVGKGLVAFGLDNASLVVLKCSSQQVRAKGWPKLLGTLGQAGQAVPG